MAILAILSPLSLLAILAILALCAIPSLLGFPDFQEAPRDARGITRELDAAACHHPAALLYPGPALPCPGTPALVHTLLHIELTVDRCAAGVHRPGGPRCRSGPGPALGPALSDGLIYLGQLGPGLPAVLPRGGFKGNRARV